MKLPKDIDEEILPLVEMLNRYHIKTIGSCSGHGKKAGYVSIHPQSIRLTLDDDGHLALDLIIEKEAIKKI